MKNLVRSITSALIGAALLIGLGAGPAATSWADEYSEPPALTSFVMTSPSVLYYGGSETEWYTAKWAGNANAFRGVIAYSDPLGGSLVFDMYPHMGGKVEGYVRGPKGMYTAHYISVMSSYGRVTYWADGRVDKYPSGMDDPPPAKIDFTSLNFRFEEAAPFSNSPDLSISGSVVVGQTIEAVFPALDPEASNVQYSWMYEDALGQYIGYGPTYLLKPEDTGKKIMARVHASKRGYQPYERDSMPSEPVTGVFVGSEPLTITGEAVVGQSLQAKRGALTPTPESLSYTWQRNGETIAGADTPQLLLTEADVGKEISVVVTARKAGYEPLVESSVPTALILNRFTHLTQPAIIGTTRTGQVLSAQSGSWEPLPEVVSYAWYRDGVIIPAATEPNYTLGTDDEGATLTVRVTAEKLGYATTSSLSSPTSNISPPLTFSDVVGTTAFYTEISWLAGRGISTGWVEEDGSRTYRPYNTIARDAMAAFLYRMAGEPDFEPPAVSPFADIDPTTAFYEEITWLAAKEISTGWTEDDGSKTFRPYDSVNRDAMAAFLYRYAGNPEFEAPANSPFIDVPAEGPFYQHISWLSSQGISTGWDAGHGCRAFNPYQPVARDAMAAFMYRLVNGGTGTVDGGGCNPPRP